MSATLELVEALISRASVTPAERLAKARAVVRARLAVTTYVIPRSMNSVSMLRTTSNSTPRRWPGSVGGRTCKGFSERTRRPPAW